MSVKSSCKLGYLFLALMCISVLIWIILFMITGDLLEYDTYSIVFLMKQLRDTNPSTTEMMKSLHQTNNPRKCLIILLGQIRAFELTYTSFQKYMLNVTHCDYALYIGTFMENTSDYNPFYKNAKYIWIWNETQFSLSPSRNIFKSFDHLMDLTISEKFTQLTENEKTEMKKVWTNGLLKLLRIRSNWIGPLAHQPGSGGVLIILRQLLYFKLKELKLLDEYKYFILTRSDYKYRCVFPMD
eukprot:236354_1